MTKIQIKKKQNSITKVECDGHTGYGVQGEDIVCSAISSIVQTAALGLLMVAAINAEIKRDDENAYFAIILPENLTEQARHDADIILGTMLCGIQDLREEYSDFIELEVQNVY